MIRRIALAAVMLGFIGAVALELNVGPAYANKVDCGKVMSEVTAGKKTSEIAKDLSISSSSVYRCKKKAGGGKSAKASPAASPAATSSPASH
jgi:hypothetical protein